MTGADELEAEKPGRAPEPAWYSCRERARRELAKARAGENDTTGAEAHYGYRRGITGHGLRRFGGPPTG
jgi:hypothetical protein